MYNNLLKDEGTITICNALSESKVSKLEELDLSDNGFGLPSAESIAAMLAVRSGLTSVR